MKTNTKCFLSRAVLKRDIKHDHQQSLSILSNPFPFGAGFALCRNAAHANLEKADPEQAAQISSRSEQ